MSTRGKIEFLEHSADCARRLGFTEAAVALQQEAEEVAASIGIEDEEKTIDRVSK